MSKVNKYYSLVQLGDEATINIYGDITSWPWEELGEVSAYNLSKQLEELSNVSKINVHISSYGGEVKEGLAIYNALKNHSAKIVTYCDSFACSIASVIFMAGDERIMSKASLLMIHNAWTYAMGNAAELRKQADDLEIISSASVEAYAACASISKGKIMELMDNETWIKPSDAVEWGFATGITEEENSSNPSQNVKEKLMHIVMAAQNGVETVLEADNNDNSVDVEKPPEELIDSSEEPQEEITEGNSEKIEAIPEENVEKPEENSAEQAENKIFSFFNAIF